MIVKLDHDRFHIKTAHIEYCVGRIRPSFFRIDNFSKYTFLFDKKDRLRIVHNVTKKEKTITDGKVSLVRDNGKYTCMRINTLATFLRIIDGKK